MTSEVLVAHTGQRLQVDITQFSSLDEFKAWVARQSSIPLQKIVTLTPEGRSVKPQTFHSEKEIYIYDIRITQPTSPANASPVVSEITLPKRHVIPAAPNSIGDIKAMTAWQELYSSRRAWALEVAEHCSKMDMAIQERYREMDVIVKCVDAAVANLEFSIKQIEPKYSELKKWVEPALVDHEQLAANWERNLALARAVPISNLMVKFMTSKDVKPNRATLEDLIELDTAKKAGRLAPTSLRKFSSKASDLDKTATRMYDALKELVQEFEKLVSRSALLHNGESAQLQQDIEAVAKKIASDYQLVLEYSTSQRDVLQASKTASTHTERLIPSLKKRAQEMDDMIQYATKARNTIAAESVEFMRSITDITSLHSSVKAQINVLNQAEDDMTTFDYLRLIHQLPYMYASFVAEAIRRREWSDKVKTDSSTLANTMAIFQDEESKRRRKWQKMVGSTYGREKFDANAIGLEVNLLGEEDPWPVMTKRDLEAFLESLRSQNAEAAIVDDVGQLLTDLNSPTKQQSKRIKAFKNGSVHEAALGISGLLVRGDDDLIRSLQEDKTKLESKVKTADSRIRRLEDLLHRQNQASRPSLGNVFQVPSSESTSSSVKPVAKAQGDGTESLLQRITQLETELNAEKQRADTARRNLDTHTAQAQDMKAEIQEANSMKRDLLENMEALKREFVEERKSLEQEIKRLQARLEDTEDEIDHFGESREHEKASYDEKVLELQNEIQRLQKERKDEFLKTQGQVDFLRKESRLQRDRSEELEKQVQKLGDEAASMTANLKEAMNTSEKQRLALQDLLNHISPGKAPISDPGDLVNTLTATASDMVRNVQAMQDNVVSLKSDLERSKTTTDQLGVELKQVSERLTSEEAASSELRTVLSQEKTRNEALEAELSSAKKELDHLRAQITDGETGSESLRKRLEEREQNVIDLKQEVAAKQSEVGRVEEELHHFKERFQDAQSKVGRLSRHMDSRAERAKDLTQRVYSQNERLCRLLERLGYAVTREGSAMTVQKIPRAERVSHLQNTTDLSDPAASTARRSSATAENGSPDAAALDLLYWMNNQDEEAETEKYQAFMDALGSFDIDLFAETLFRRVKDMEHLARKFQRESRTYREKGLALQREAHEKIAFKNFKEGDLALFLPTRNQSSGAWACFNVGFPHYFLREQDSHSLRNREWLVARITRIQERVVDLSKSVQHHPHNHHHNHGDADSLNDDGNDNPFQLSDGLRWYLLDAHEDKHGAPSTPGLGKSTVAANNVEAVAEMRSRAGAGGKDTKHRLSQHSIEGVSKTLSKSLESRRGSTSSRKTLPFAIGGGGGLLKGTPLASETNSICVAPSDTPLGTSPVAAQGSQQLAASGLAARATRDEGNGVDSSQQLGENARTRAGGGETREASAERTGAEASLPRLDRERSVVYESLWSLDLSYESPSKKR